MTNTIIDFIRIPVDENGQLLYDIEEVRHIVNTYKNIFPNHLALVIPSNIQIWENVNIEELKLIKKYIENIISQKEE